ncbi:MAG: hypothetical protein ABS36_14115 [Acidobacteria bacterium SCN 69-37]|nr:MAG: hypothetical protein ABS36_14115 [Acidobacteria bacterium SCN 69-37]
MSAQAIGRLGLCALAWFGLSAGPAYAQGVGGAISSPGPNATVMQPFTITGWALHGPTTGTGIDAVHIYGCTTVCTFWGAATYGLARPDVSAVYGAQYLNTGYTFTKTGLTPGSYYLQVHAHSTINGAWYQWGHFLTVQAQPEHTLERPGPGASVASPVAVQGWALDANAPSGTGVTQINLWTHPNPGSGQVAIMLGQATYGANRADIAASHGERFRYSGYTASLAGLAPGAHYIGAAAFSPSSNVWDWRWKTAYVDVSTAPLTIDRPGTGTGGVTATGLTCVGGSTTQAVPCGASYPLHTVVTLTAAPDANSTFAGWGGSCTGTGTCQVTLSTARFVVATFTKLPDTVALRYYHTDPVGSVRAITDEVGAVVERHDYRPFGEDVAPLTGDPNRFAGKPLDPETALHYFDARYYRQTWGRFTQVDPLHVGAAMTDPQQWNRYAYARNNPFKWADPTGLAACEAAYCGTETMIVHGSLEYVPPGSGNGWAYWNVGSASGMACGSPPTGEDGWRMAYNSNGDCYAWFFEGSGTASRGGTPVPASGTPPPLPPSEPTASPDDEPPTEPPPCRDALCEVIRDTARRTAPFLSALEWLAATGLQVGSLVNPWIALGHCAIIGCTSGEVALAIMPVSPKILRQMSLRGWTHGAIDEAIASGRQVRAVNRANGNPATRYVHPSTGKSVVVDDVAGDVIHVGGPGFRYGPGSGDLP